MSSPSPKGHFSAEIGQDLIEEALRSVSKHGPNQESQSTDQGGGTAANETERLKAELLEAQEKCVRATADLENYKKRAQKEKEDIQRFGAEKLLSDILPVADNLERALAHASNGEDFAALRQGVDMTRKLLAQALAKSGVEAFSSVGKPFDPRVHEAIQQMETTEMAPDHVLLEVICGYTLNGRLVRPARVVVSKSPGPSTETNGCDPKSE